MKRRFYITLLFSFFFSITSFPQNPEWLIYNETNSGLPGNEISCIENDEFGNMWIGVDSDSCYLVKFNEINWEVNYTLGSRVIPPSVYINRITSIITSDDNGIMWLGTTHGLVEFDGESFTKWDTTNSVLPNNDVRDIAIDSEGNKWIATSPRFFGTNETYGLAKIDSEWRVTIYDTLNSEIPSNDVWCIEIDKYDNIWVGTSNYAWAPFGGKGLAKFDGTTWTVYNRNNTELPSNNIIDIKIDENDNKWILTESGLAKYDNSSWTVYITDSYDYWAVDCLTIDKSGSKFIGTCGSTNGTLGMLKFDGTTWSQYDENNSGLPSHHIGNIAVDKFNNKWIGANYGDAGPKAGLVIYNENGVVTKLKDELSVYPNHYKLNQNYPNPFNPSTTINYSIPKQTDVTLKVYDVLGSEVATLVNKLLSEGNYTIEFDASKLTSGIYLYRLQAGEFVETKKMILLK